MATKATRSNFYFVNPSEPLGTRDAYDGDAPARVFERTSWEWLWERYLRRREVLRAFSVPMSTDYLADRKGAYSVLRHVPRTRSPVAAPSGRVYHEPGWALPGKTPLSDGSPAWVPVEGTDGGEVWERYRKVPRYATYDVVFHVADLGGLVATDAFEGRPPYSVSGGLFDSLCWYRDPDDADPSGKTASGSVTETSSVDCEKTNVGGEGTTVVSGHDSSEASVTPMGPWSFFPVFRLLGDYRADDAPVATAVPVWDPESAEYVDRTAYFSMSPGARTPDYRWDRGEFREEGYVKRGTATAGSPGGETRTVRYLDLAGVTQLTASLGFLWDPGANLDPAEGTYGAGGLGGQPRFFVRHGKSTVDPSPVQVPVGLHVDPPAPERGGVGASGGRLLPSPDWDGKPTCWSAWGFPKIPSCLAGTPFGRQLAAFCRAQPAPPPWIHSYVTAMPAGDETEDSPRPYGLSFAGRRPPERPYPVACACEPSNVSGMLDKMTRTVTEVTGCKLFAHVSFSRTDRRRVSDVFTYAGYYSSGASSSSRSSTREERATGSFLGTFGELLGQGHVEYSVPGSATVRTVSDVFSATDWREDDETGSGWHWESAVETSYYVGECTDTVGDTEFSATGIVLLRDRDADHEKPYPQVYPSSEFREESVDSDGRRRTDDRGKSEGFDGDGWVPDDADLLVSPDVAAWARSAELIAVLDVDAIDDAGTGRVHERKDRAAHTESYSGTRSRTSYVKRSVVRLGSVDLKTGVLDGGVSWRALGAVPEGARPNIFAPDSTYEKLRYESRHDKDGEDLYERDTYADVPTHDVHVVSARLFLSVEWDFDTDDPPEPKGQASGCAKLVRKLAPLGGRMAAASRRKASADGALGSAADEAVRLRDLLDALREVLETGESAYVDELRDAREALDDAREALDDAREALDDAREALASAAPDDPSRPSLAAAVEAAVDAVVAWTKAVADARSRIDALVGLEEASEEDAAAALDGLEGAIGDLEGALDDAGTPSSGDGQGTGLSGAADEALSAADEALSAADEAARSCSPGAEDAVDAAEDAVDAAEDAVDALLEALRGAEDGHGDAFGGVLKALSDANAAAGDARKKTWAAVSPST